MYKAKVNIKVKNRYYLTGDVIPEEYIEAGHMPYVDVIEPQLCDVSTEYMKATDVGTDDLDEEETDPETEGGEEAEQAPKKKTKKAKK